MKTEIDEVTCNNCGHVWELTTVYDGDNGQTDYTNPECPECDTDIREE